MCSHLVWLYFSDTRKELISCFERVCYLLNCFTHVFLCQIQRYFRSRDAVFLFLLERTEQGYFVYYLLPGWLVKSTGKSCQTMSTFCNSFHSVKSWMTRFFFPVDLHWLSKYLVIPWIWMNKWNKNNVMIHSKYASLSNIFTILCQNVWLSFVRTTQVRHSFYLLYFCYLS
jgi:hypothetical protein